MNTIPTAPSIPLRITMPRLPRLPRLAMLAVLFCFLPLQSLTAQVSEKQIVQTKKQIEELLHKAEDLQEHGHEKAAKEAMQKAVYLKEKLGHLLEHGRKGERGKGNELERMQKILHGLAQGIEALKAMGRREEVAHMERLGRELKEKIHAMKEHRGGQDREREMAKRQLKLYRDAFAGLAEAGKKDAAEQMEHAIHAMELALEGRRDEEAMHIRKTAPKRGAMAELLLYGAKCLKEFKQPDRAEAVARLGKQFAEQERKRRGGNKELKKAEWQLKVMRYAVEALAEAGKHDGADIMERALHARKIALAGRRDREAMQIRERAPNRNQQAEFLGIAAEILQDRGKGERAMVVAELAGELAGRRREQPRREREHREGERREGERREGRRREGERREGHREGERGGRQDALKRLEHLQRQLEEIREVMEALRRELKD